MDEIDCAIWQRVLARVVRRYGWEVLTYCLTFLAVGTTLAHFSVDAIRARRAYRELVRSAHVPVPGTREIAFAPGGGDGIDQPQSGGRGAYAA